MQETDNIQKQYKPNQKFLDYCAEVSKIVQTWPPWKQCLLGIKNSSYEKNMKKASQ